MSYRTLDIPTGVGGGAQQLCRASKFPRSIHVTVINTDATNAHAAFFGRSRRELVISPSGLQTGFALPVSPAAAPAAGNGVQFAPGAGVIQEPIALVGGGNAPVAISSYVLQGWAGELWAVADVTGKVQVDVFDSGVIEA